MDHGTQDQSLYAEFPATEQEYYRAIIQDMSLDNNMYSINLDIPFFKKRNKLFLQ